MAGRGGDTSGHEHRAALSSLRATIRSVDTSSAWNPPTPRREAIPEAQRRSALTDGTGLEALRLLVPPPETPYLGDGTWERLFDELGTQLPAEYVTLTDCYGAGCWSNWLRFVTPLSTGARRFTSYASEVLDGYRSLREEFPEDFPLPVWPESGGFLPFANSIDGDELGWMTEGNPDEWPLIVYPRHADQGPPMPGNLTETLLEWLRGRFTTEGLPGYDELDDPLEFIDFTPWDGESHG